MSPTVPLRSWWRNGYSVGLAINRPWFKSYPGQKLRNNVGQVVHTYVPLSVIVTKQYNLRTGQGATMLCDWEGNRRPGESDGSLPPGG